MMVKEECYAISRYGGNLISYDAVAKLSVFDRRYLLHKLATDAKRQQDEQDKLRAKSANKSSMNRRKL